MALPASTTKGSALLYNAMDCNLHCEVCVIFLSKLLCMIPIKWICYFIIHKFSLSYFHIWTDIPISVNDESEIQIDAHRSPLAAMVFSSNGMYIATASEQGTLVRVHLVSDATKVMRHSPFVLCFFWVRLFAFIHETFLATVVYGFDIISVTFLLRFLKSDKCFYRSHIASEGVHIHLLYFLFRLGHPSSFPIF